VECKKLNIGLICRILNNKALGCFVRVLKEKHPAVMLENKKLNIGMI
jgi:hypothetical protein